MLYLDELNKEFFIVCYARSIDRYLLINAGVI